MIRKICLIAGQNFSGWHRNARIWLTFTLGLVLCLMLSDQMLTRAQTYEAAIQIFEPFIWTFGDSGALPPGAHNAGDLAGRPGGLCGAFGDRV